MMVRRTTLVPFVCTALLMLAALGLHAFAQNRGGAGGAGGGSGGAGGQGGFGFGGAGGAGAYGFGGPGGQGGGAFFGGPGAMAMMRGVVGGTAIAATQQFVYVVQGNQLYQYKADGLQLVRRVELEQPRPPMPPDGDAFRPGSGAGR